MKRFTKEKMQQVEQLISYVTLMGLTGEDLVSIGGKMTRDSKRDIIKANMEIVRSFNCLKIGGDAHTQSRFKLKTPAGNYNIEQPGWYHHEWVIHSLKTKVKKTVAVDPRDYDLPRHLDYQNRARCALLLHIAAGKIPLNF